MAELKRPNPPSKELVDKAQVRIYTTIFEEDSTTFQFYAEYNYWNSDNRKTDYERPLFDWEPDEIPLDIDDVSPFDYVFLTFDPIEIE
jgi:hypothetical protein